MNIYDAMFIIGLFGCLTIIGLKLYNLLYVGKFYDIKVAILLFCGYAMSFLFVMISIFTNPIELYIPFFILCSAMLPINIGFLLFEIIFLIKDIARPVIKPYMSRNMLK